MPKKERILKNRSSIKVNVRIIILKEDKYYVAYCPALELSSYGDTKKEAINCFTEAMDIFIEETEKKGTLEKCLLKLGWTLKQEPKPNYIPPPIPSETLNRLIKCEPSQVIDERIAIPL